MLQKMVKFPCLSFSQTVAVGYLLLTSLCVICSASTPSDSGLRCNVTNGCPGQRPLTPGSCCPVLPWGQCDQHPDNQCDVTLGYTCVDSVCSGEMKVAAVSIGPRSVTLTWRDFILEHPGYQHEYSVLYTDLFTGNSTEWLRVEVGQSPVVTLRNLSPATWYFVKVGIWDDPLLQTYSLFSETLMFKTVDAAFCDYYGGQVAVGDNVVIECEEYCLCLPTGEFMCNLVCMGASPEQHPRCTETSHTGDPCCFDAVQCAPDGCVYGDEIVTDGSSWLIGCDERCTCTAGDVLCLPLCAHVDPPDNCSQPELEKTDGDCCGSWKCSSIDNPCQNGSSVLRLTGQCDVCSCDEEGKEECSPLTDCGPITLPRNSSVCQRPRIVDGVCCPYIVCSDPSGNIPDGVNPILFSANSLGFSSMTLRVRADDILTQGQISLHYTNDINTIDIDQWESVNFIPENTTVTHNVPGQTLIQTLTTVKGAVYLGSAYFISVTNLEPMSFYYLKLSILTKNGSDADRRIVSTVVCVKIRGARPPLPSASLQSRPESKIEVANVTSTSAVLQWVIPRHISAYRRYLVLKYSSLGTGQTLYTDQINSSTTYFILEHLNHSTLYRVSLHILQEATAIEPAIVESVFQTNASSKKQKIQNEMEILAVQLSVSQAILQWKPFRRRYLDHIVQMEAFWVDPSEKNVTYRTVVQSNVTSFTIRDLKESTFYVAWLGLLLHDGTVVFSSKIHFLTKQSPEPPHPEYHRNIVVAASVSTVSIILVIVIVIALIYVIRCRWRRCQYQTHTSFDNKIFQIRCDKDDVSL